MPINAQLIYSHDISRVTMKMAVTSAAMLLRYLPASTPPALPSPSAAGFAAQVAAQKQARLDRVAARRKSDADLVASKRTLMREYAERRKREEGAEKAAKS
jgi:hypothetical protein